MTWARLVVFDLDGTLVDSSRDLAAAVNAALARVAPDAAPLSLDTVRSFVGDGAAVLIERSLSRAGLHRPAADVLPVFLECYRERLLDTTVLYPGAVEVLDHLAGSALAVLTNKPGDMSRTILDRLGVGGRFRWIYGGGDVPAKKPDPVGLKRLLVEAGVGPGDAVMVGDSAIDVRTARSAGVASVGATYGFDPASLRDARPDMLVNDLRELPGILEAPRVS